MTLQKPHLGEICSHFIQMFRPAVMMLQDCTLFLILLSFALDRESMKKDVNRKDIMSVTSLLLRKLI